MKPKREQVALVFVVLGVFALTAAYILMFKAGEHAEGEHAHGKKLHVHDDGEAAA